MSDYYCRASLVARSHFNRACGDLRAAPNFGFARAHESLSASSTTAIPMHLCAVDMVCGSPVSRPAAGALSGSGHSAQVRTTQLERRARISTTESQMGMVSAGGTVFNGVSPSAACEDASRVQQRPRGFSSSTGGVDLTPSSAVGANPKRNLKQRSSELVDRALVAAAAAETEVANHRDNNSEDLFARDEWRVSCSTFRLRGGPGAGLAGRHLLDAHARITRAWIDGSGHDVRTGACAGLRVHNDPRVARNLCSRDVHVVCDRDENAVRFSVGEDSDHVDEHSSFGDDAFLDAAFGVHDSDSEMGAARPAPRCRGFSRQLASVDQAAAMGGHCLGAELQPAGQLIPAEPDSGPFVDLEQEGEHQFTGAARATSLRSSRGLAGRQSDRHGASLPATELAQRTADCAMLRKPKVTRTGELYSGGGQSRQGGGEAEGDHGPSGYDAVDRESGSRRPTLRGRFHKTRVRPGSKRAAGLYPDTAHPDPDGGIARLHRSPLRGEWGGSGDVAPRRRAGEPIRATRSNPPAPPRADVGIGMARALERMPALSTRRGQLIGSGSWRCYMLPRQTPSVGAARVGGVS
jgi:hypothetical protein